MAPSALLLIYKRNDDSIADEVRFLQPNCFLHAYLRYMRTMLVSRLPILMQGNLDFQSMLLSEHLHTLRKL